MKKNEEQPVEISLNDESLTMVYSLTHENGDGVTLKKQIVKRKLLEKKLEENTAKMKRIKKKVINCKYYCFLKELTKNFKKTCRIFNYLTTVENNKQVQFNLPKNYEESFYLNEVAHLTNRDPVVENNLINLIKNRDDFKKWLLATGDYGKDIEDDLNAIVGYSETFTNAIARHSLDIKDEAIFRNPNPINVTFHDMKKFDFVNPVIGKLATQVKASKLTDDELTKNLLMQGEIDALQNRFDRLKYGDKKDDDNNTQGG